MGAFFRETKLGNYRICMTVVFQKQLTAHSL